MEYIKNFGQPLDRNLSLLVGNFIYFEKCRNAKSSKTLYVSATEIKHELCDQWSSNLVGAHEFTPGFSGFPVARSFVFCVVLCRSLFVLLSFFLAIAFYVLLRYTDLYYAFDICNLCLWQQYPTRPRFSLGFCAMLCRSLFVLLSFSFNHCIV